ncbi:CD83 antigen isoform X2 [Cottoperca gobio]|uniref:CD83 antigen isoform X2 n=1 Tax=Cottoperca gobio TaxID=56716 RepID=A0A6J2RBS8_COTGO|nr:CD83 antigen isoform X2 [Cottoperca gobio]
MSAGLHLVLLMLLCVDRAVGRPVHGDILEIKSVSGTNSALECTTKSKPGVQYIAVRWYKVGEAPSPRLSGLLTKDLPSGPTQWYIGVEREVELLGESCNIFLRNVTCGDSGMYMCHLAAPVGQQNREGQVRLTVTDCPAEDPAEDLMTDTYLVVFASVVLLLALLIFLISYFEEYHQGQKQENNKRNFVGFEQNAERKGLKVDLYFGT